MQKHDATRLHYDFRLEVDGVLVSWAIPKGPPVTHDDRRLAVRVEDHPLDYGDFEGVIPKGEYGGGTVMLWDRGDYINLRGEKEGAGRMDMSGSLDDGLVEIHLDGEKLKGDFALKRFRVEHGKEQWLMLQMKGTELPPDLLDDADKSVKTGRSMDAIADAG